MQPLDASALATRKCLPCEGGVEAYTPDAAKEQIKVLSGWALTDDGKMIRRKWTLKNFVQGMQLLQKAADLAEEEQHHPDFHLTGYRHVTIELTTHAIGGLSENDFILAAKIDAATEASES